MLDLLDEPYLILQFVGVLLVDALQHSDAIVGDADAIFCVQ